MNISESDRTREGKQPLRWGLIGCGDISRKRVAPALRDLEECDFVAVSRERDELAEAFATEFGARKWYARWQDLVADDEIEAVYIATPVHLHAEQTIAAARAGKHVLCEKPMALSPAGCERMISACEANYVLLGIAYYRHFYPVIQRVKAILASGEIGDPVIVQMNAFSHFDPGPGHARSWLLEKRKSGGGPMRDFGCHRIEVMMNLMGPIGHTASHLTKTALQREVEDTAVAAFEFERGGMGVLTVTHAAWEPQDTLDVFGTEGSVHVSNLNEGLLRVRTARDERAETHPVPSNLHAPLIADFVEAVAAGRQPTVDGAVGKEVDVILDTIYRQGEGRELTLTGLPPM